MPEGVWPVACQAQQHCSHSGHQYAACRGSILVSRKERPLRAVSKGLAIVLG
jgi:hypothetical protein